jgi:transcriptional regulator with XRE-family HTH domain
MQIARWEQGIAQPHPGNLSALAKALLVHPSYFFQPKNMSEMVSVVTLARQRQRKAKKTIRRNSDIA